MIHLIFHIHRVLQISARNYYIPSLTLLGRAYCFVHSEKGRGPGFDLSIHRIVINFDTFLPFFLYLMEDSLLNRAYSADTATSSVSLPSSIGNSSRSSSTANNSAKRRIDLNTPASHQQKW